MAETPSLSLATTRTAHPDWTFRAWFFMEIRVRRPFELDVMPILAGIFITGTALGWPGGRGAAALIPLAVGAACGIGSAMLWLFLGRSGRLPDWAVSADRRHSLVGLWRDHRRAVREAQPLL